MLARLGGLAESRIAAASGNTSHRDRRDGDMIASYRVRLVSRPSVTPLAALSLGRRCNPLDYGPVPCRDSLPNRKGPTEWSTKSCVLDPPWPRPSTDRPAGGANSTPKLLFFRLSSAITPP